MSEREQAEKPEKNEQADDAHEDGDHAQDGLRGRSRNRGLEVLHGRTSLMSHTRT